MVRRKRRSSTGEGFGSGQDRRELKSLEEREHIVGQVSCLYGDRGTMSQGVGGGSVVRYGR